MKTLFTYSCIMALDLWEELKVKSISSGHLRRCSRRLPSEASASEQRSCGDARAERDLPERSENSWASVAK